MKVSLATLQELKDFLKEHKVYVIYERTDAGKLYICKESEYERTEGLNVK
jgi:hypothetical protein